MKRCAGFFLHAQFLLLPLAQGSTRGATVLPTRGRALPRKRTMSDAGSVELVAPPSALTHAHIGPVIAAHATVFRYAAAVGVVLVIFAVRAALAPLLGVQAPLLP